jgi:fructokinase
MIIVTQGAAGSIAFTKDGGRTEMAGIGVKTVDTTGAGDAFLAGLLHGLLEHPDDWREHLAEILHFANAVGALTTTKRGAIPALPSRKKVRELAKSAG